MFVNDEKDLKISSALRQCPKYFSASLLYKLSTFFFTWFSWVLFFIRRKHCVMLIYNSHKTLPWDTALGAVTRITVRLPKV